MKIACQSCGAKYTIADEKVVGKIVKIRCKKCSSTIVINGNDSAALAAGGADAAALPEFAPTAAISGEPWTVNVADGDQRTLSASEIIQLYKTGEVNEETYCWRDGMADWLPLREIAELYSAAHIRSTLEPDNVDAAPASNRGGSDTALGGGGAGNMFGGGMGASEEVAARRVGGRGAGGGDLFAQAARAGGEDDVMTSAPMSGGGGGGGAVDDGKLTGQRNENSVLFSLSALTQNAPKEEKQQTTEGSGLIDIRALATSSKADTGDKRAKVDDIMNLGGGGAFSAALAAPVLAAPPLEVAHVADTNQGGNKQNKSMLFAIIGAGALVAAAILVFALKSGNKTDATTPTAANATTLPAGSTLPASTDTTNPGTAVAANTATTPTSTDNTPPPAAPGTGAALAANAHPTAGAAGHGSTAAAHLGGPAIADPTPPPAAPPPSRPAQSLAGAIAQAGGDNGSAAPSGGGGGGGSAPFDRGQASAALGAVNVASCKKADGPTGSGHVSVTFAPNGSVSTAVVDSPPFDGTSVGGCVASKFRGAHIPAFAGGPVKVGKSFTIN